MGETQSLLKQKEAVERASNWRSVSEDTAGFDRAYESFVKVMTQRRLIAQEILKENNELRLKELKDMFDHYNDEIRKILGL